MCIRDRSSAMIRVFADWLDMSNKYFHHAFMIYHVSYYSATWFLYCLESSTESWGYLILYYLSPKYQYSNLTRKYNFSSQWQYYFRWWMFISWLPTNISIKNLQLFDLHWLIFDESWFSLHFLYSLQTFLICNALHFDGPLHTNILYCFLSF